MSELLPPEEREARSARTEAWRREFTIRHGARCHYCNRRATADLGPDDRPWHIDHMKPLARGGTDDEANLALACKRCNLVKNTRSYKDFVEIARMAFWQPDDDWRLSEAELDSLMGRYSWLPAPWYVNERSGRTQDSSDGDDPTYAFVLSTDANEVEPLLRAGTHPAAGGAVQLAADMFKALPALISELRLLRSERQTSSGR